MMENLPDDELDALARRHDHGAEGFAGPKSQPRNPMPQGASREHKHHHHYHPPKHHHAYGETTPRQLMSIETRSGQAVVVPLFDAEPATTTNEKHETKRHSDYNVGPAPNGTMRRAQRHVGIGPSFRTENEAAAGTVDSMKRETSRPKRHTKYDYEERGPEFAPHTTMTSARASNAHTVVSPSFEEDRQTDIVSITTEKQTNRRLTGDKGSYRHSDYDAAALAHAKEEGTWAATFASEKKEKEKLAGGATKDAVDRTCEPSSADGEGHARPNTPMEPGVIWEGEGLENDEESTQIPDPELAGTTSDDREMPLISAVLVQEPDLVGAEPLKDESWWTNRKNRVVVFMALLIILVGLAVGLGVGLTSSGATSQLPMVVPDCVGEIALSWGDPHMITFDNFKYDCQGDGEFVLLRTLDNSVEIQGRFTASGTGPISTTTAVAIRQGDETPIVQVELPETPSPETTTIGGCPVDLYVDGKRRSVSAGSGQDGLVRVEVTDNGVHTIYPSTGMAVTASIMMSTGLSSSRFGCYLNVFVCLPETNMPADVLGLMGTPNNDTSDDWMDPQGNTLEMPTLPEDLLFERAYEYCTSNWCVTNSNESLFTYDQGTTFEDYNNCDAPYPGSVDVESASEEVKARCKGNVACLIDGTVGGINDADDAVQVTEELEIARERTSETSPLTSTPTQASKCTVMSDFENGVDGWTIAGDAQDASMEPSYSATDGNPGGHIYAVDDGHGQLWYFRAPPEFHGDFSGAYGHSLDFDLRQSLTNRQYNDRDVIIYSGESLIWFDTAENPGTEWTSYSVSLKQGSGWKTDDDTAASGVEILSILSDITDIWIRGEYRSGDDTGRLDNVILLSSCPGSPLPTSRPTPATTPAPTTPAPTTPAPTTPAPTTPAPTTPAPTTPAPTTPAPTPEYPPIPIDYCDRTAAPRGVISETNKKICPDGSLEYALDPDPADTVYIKVLKYATSGYSKIRLRVTDASFNEIKETGTHNSANKELVEFEAKSQPGGCGVPAFLEVKSEGCPDFDLTVQYIERLDFNTAGTGFNDAPLVIPANETGPFFTCGNINYVSSCEDRHYWKLHANESDEIYFNGLIEGGNTNAYLTFFDEFQTQVDWTFVLLRGRKNLEKKFVAEKTGTHYLRLEAPILFYAIAFRVN